MGQTSSGHRQLSVGNKELEMKGKMRYGRCPGGVHCSREETHKPAVKSARSEAW